MCDWLMLWHLGPRICKTHLVGSPWFESTSKNRCPTVAMIYWKHGFDSSYLRIKHNCLIIACFLVKLYQYLAPKYVQHWAGTAPNIGRSLQIREGWFQWHSMCFLDDLRRCWSWFQLSRYQPRLSSEHVTWNSNWWVLSWPWFHEKHMENTWL